ncbi:MFS transporter [Aurantiacibacter spongiae]|uniref:MFS transporter n=1 Tax=Aurantiacibacter spongiae TaxID=2488860 RepID=A0A3N5DRF8_9SPHN|nr:MFS transporter [Aurantiacibacter spongiae]RPF71761.1 MFS transporter [Aurantiacibacter spongiae]
MVSTDSLRGSYPATLAIALFALIPYLLVSSAGSLLEGQIQHDLEASRAALGWAGSLSTAGYAFGALFAGDLVQRHPRRRLLPLLALATCAGWLCAAIAQGPVAYVAGHVLAGLTTGMLLVVSLPPVITGFSEKVTISAGFISLGLFGAIAAGPMVGGLVAAGPGWRGFHLALAAIALSVAGFSRVVLRDNDPPNPELPRDYGALVLAFLGTVLPFSAVALLAGRSFGSAWFLVPLGIGLACFAGIFLYEERRQTPLVPIHKTIHTLPIIGTLIAAFAGGVFLSLLELSVGRTMQLWQFTPLKTGLTFSPLLLGAALAALILARLFRSRYLPVLILVGLVMMIGSGIMLIALASSSPWPWLSLALTLLGFGAGATVSPALFLAAFSLRSSLLPRVFAFIELVRSVGDFLMGPILRQYAATLAAPEPLTDHAVALSMAIALAVGVIGTIVCTVLFRAAFRRLPVPQVDTWLEEEDAVAIQSPDIFPDHRQ